MDIRGGQMSNWCRKYNYWGRRHPQIYNIPAIIECLSLHSPMKSLSCYVCFLLLPVFLAVLPCCLCFQSASFLKLLSCVCCARDIYKCLVLRAEHFVPIGRNKSFWYSEHFVSTARNKMYLSLKRTVSLIETNRIPYWNTVFCLLKHSPAKTKWAGGTWLHGRLFFAKKSAIT